MRIQTLTAFSSSLLALVLTACGQNTDVANVTVNLGVPTQSGVQKINLMSSLSSVSQASQMLLTGPSCKQKNVFAVVRLNEDETQIFTYPVDFTTTIAGTAPTTDIEVAQLFASATLDHDIVVPVPKGAVFDFGVIGAFYAPIDANGDGICDLSTGAFPAVGTVNPSYIAVGRRKAIVNGDTTLGLNVFTHQSSPSGYTPGCAVANNIPAFSQDCAKKNFMTVSRANISDTFNYIIFEYLSSKNRPEHVVQAFNQPTSTEHFILPRIVPIKIRFKYVSAASEQVQVITSALNAGAPVPSPSPSPGSNTPFYAQEY